MTNKNTIEFVAGRHSTALINQLAEELNLTPEEVVQKGITFMALYAGLRRENNGHILLQEGNDPPRILTL
ncbi:hypothetical protein [Aphanothece sacrum]|uniref:ABC transporter n=1 Tax=Aphanothece sacrum FPU1 TaxID=1920663 RepID=A0A401ICV6_APHSA|nr:hypothetical protein [Aphanothece sacrum]GBF79000.1 ABC transporter [Aphanothece sacrum FPU1]GBF84449.1 hypothetical protein AsFPU3_1498 [Aphanothece sacrum FPU3]